VVDRAGAQPYERFVATVDRPAASVPLDEATLCIAAHAEPSLDVDAYLHRLDAVAEGVRAPTLDGLVNHLFSTLRFAGNRRHYYDPRNSFLNYVLDRRVGIPITLSVVVMEVGRRIGVPVAGVGMPGHFLLRDKVDPDVFVDPFDRGRLLDAEGCRQLFEATAGISTTWDPGFLEPVDRHAIVGRVLANLRGIYEAAADLGALAWIFRLRAALPTATRADHDELARFMARFN